VLSPQALGALGLPDLRGSWPERDLEGQVFPTGTSVGSRDQEDVVCNRVGSQVALLMLPVEVQTFARSESPLRRKGFGAVSNVLFFEKLL